MYGSCLWVYARVYLCAIWNDSCLPAVQNDSLYSLFFTLFILPKLIAFVITYHCHCRMPDYSSIKRQHHQPTRKRPTGCVDCALLEFCIKSLARWSTFHRECIENQIERNALLDISVARNQNANASTFAIISRAYLRMNVLQWYVCSMFIWYQRTKKRWENEKCTGPLNA